MSANWLASDSWFGVDKIDHFVYAMACWLVLNALTSSLWAQLGLFTAGAVGIELLELARYVVWTRKKQPQPWPLLCDQFSYRDLVWGAAGALTAIWALAKIAGRAIAVLAFMVILANVASAQAPAKKVFHPFHMGSATLDSTAYGQELQLYLPPFHGLVILAPAGDTIVMLNGVLYDSTLAPTSGLMCTAPLGSGPPRFAVLVSRLVIGRPDSVWWSQDFPERGQTRLYPHWAQLTPRGDTVRLEEAWRRRSDCSQHDGTLVVLFELRRGEHKP